MNLELSALQCQVRRRLYVRKVIIVLSTEQMFMKNVEMERIATKDNEKLLLAQLDISDQVEQTIMIKI